MAASFLFQDNLLIFHTHVLPYGKYRQYTSLIVFLYTGKQVFVS